MKSNQLEKTITSILLATWLALGGASPFAWSLPAAPTNADELTKGAILDPIFDTVCDSHSSDLSPDAVQLSESLGLTGKFKELDELKRRLAQLNGQKAPVELRQDIGDLRFDIMATIQQTNLEVAFVIAEIEKEEAVMEEILKAYTQERDARVNRANLWAFRTNGSLWAIAEALSIPTYKYPKLSIPGGTVGIVAGLVPSIFSAFAVRSSSGRWHERGSYPNMLTKLYDFPTCPRTEFPDSVWAHLNSKPSGENRTRREMLLDHWRYNSNFPFLKSGETAERLKILTGATSQRINMEVLADRLIMTRQMKAVVLQMNRPLLELSMALQGKKTLRAF